MSTKSAITGWIICFADEEGFPHKAEVVQDDSTKWISPPFDPKDALSEDHRITEVELYHKENKKRGLVLSRISGEAENSKIHFKALRISNHLARAKTGIEKII